MYKKIIYIIIQYYIIQYNQYIIIKINYNYIITKSKKVSPGFGFAAFNNFVNGIYSISPIYIILQLFKNNLLYTNILKNYIVYI